jgi:uncharacterized OB-fold protein
MPKCPHCGNNCAPDAEFCPKCGKKKPGDNPLATIIGVVIFLALLGSCMGAC